MINRGQWASYFALAYGELNCAFTRSNQLGLVAWMAGERQPDIAIAGPRNNPLSCTLWVPGAEPFNEVVWHYPSLNVGIWATLATLEQPTEGGYAPIRQWLRNGGCGCAILHAVASSGWGTFEHWSEADTNAFMEDVARAPATYLAAPVPGS